MTGPRLKKPPKPPPPPPPPWPPPPPNPGGRLAGRGGGSPRRFHSLRFMRASFAPMNQDFVHSNARQTGHEFLPVFAAVQRNIETEFRPRVQKILVLRIFANHIYIADCWQIANDRCPGGAVIVSVEQVRL